MTATFGRATLALAFALVAGSAAAAIPWSTRVASRASDSFALSAVVFGRVASPAELKIGIVDIQRAINDCQAGKEAKKAIIKEAEKFQGLVQQKQKDLQTLKETLLGQSYPLAPSQSHAANLFERQLCLAH